MRRVVLIGTSHNYQLSDVELYAASADLFRKLLRVICYAHEAHALAEEMHPDEMTRRGATKSVAHAVAKELGLVHQYSDLSDAERSLYGYQNPLVIWTEANRIAPRGTSKNEVCKLIEPEVRRNQAIRENRWLKNLLKLNTWPVVFVCGADHSVHFAALVRERSISVTVAFEDWKPLTL